MVSFAKRLKLLRIPVDIVTEENLARLVDEILKSGESKQIVFLDLHEMMKARRIQEKGDCLRRAALVIPTSRLIAWAARMLRQPSPTIWTSYSFVIRLMGALEARRSSVYLLGSTMKGIRKAEATVRSSFPNLGVVGRFTAHYPSNREKDVLMAIRKSSPDLLLTGSGLSGRYLWIHRRRQRFAPGITLWEPHCFDVFSGRRGKPKSGAGTLFFQGIFGAIPRPWRLLRPLRYLWFFILVTAARIRG